MIYLSKNKYTGNGVTTNRTLTFAFLDRTHVKTYVDGVDTAFTWITDSEVQISPAPASGSQIEIRRETPKTARLVDWQDGAGVTEKDMDTADLQVLYISQEAFDIATDSLPAATTAASAWDAQSNRIINVADAVNDSDAVNKLQVQSFTSAAVASTAADAVQTAADAVQTAADRVQTGLDVVSTGENAVSAAASAAAAASSAAEGLYNNVIGITSANSPFTPTGTQDGTLFRVDTSGGNVVINLSTLATYAEDMKLAFVKTTGDANTVTVNRGGTDTINGSTSDTLDSQYVVTVYVGDSGTGSWIRVLQNASIADNAVTNAKLADMVDATIKGRAAGAGTGDPTDLTGAQVATIVGASSETYAGVVELATDAEAQAKTDSARALTPANLSALAATSSFSGLVTLAENQDARTGTDTTKAVTPANVKALWEELPTQATTSGSSKDFTIGAEAKRVTLTFSGCSTTGTANPKIQLGDAGGIETSGYLGAASFCGGSTGSANFTDSFGITSVLAANILHGSVILTRAVDGSNTWACQGVLATSNSSFTFQTAGVKSLSQELSTVRVTTTDTWDAGLLSCIVEY